MKLLRAVSALVLLLVLASLAACGSPASDPAETMPGVAPAVDATPFTIARFESGDFLANSREDMEYLQGLLQKKGWNIRLEAQVYVNDSFDKPTDYGKLFDSVAAAGTLADGYTLRVEEARGLALSGHVRNMAAAVKQAAPALYGRYGAYFDKDGLGIPMMASRAVWGCDTVLYLRNGLAERSGAKSWKLTDVLALMESDDGIRIGSWGQALYNSVFDLLNAWVGEMGYYPLDFAGISGGFAAALNDPECTPVPVESIQGFDDVYRRLLELSNDGRFFNVHDTQAYSDDADGYIGMLNNMMDPVFLIKQKLTGDDFTALPLLSFSAPMLPEDDPYVYMVLAVPALSRKAEQVARFAEWAVMGRDGYDLVTYGAEGVDYRMAGDRIEFLAKGKAMTREDWDPSVSKTYKNYVLPFSNEWMDRVTVYAPRNYDAVARNRPDFSPPLFLSKELRDPLYVWKWFGGVLDEQLETIASNREHLLCGITQTESGDKQSDSEECLAQLRAMSADTEKVVDAYRAKIQELLEGQPK